MTDKKDDAQSILSELRKVLAGLTKGQEKEETPGQAKSESPEQVSQQAAETQPAGSAPDAITYQEEQNVPAWTPPVVPPVPPEPSVHPGDTAPRTVQTSADGVLPGTVSIPGGIRGSVAGPASADGVQPSQKTRDECPSKQVQLQEEVPETIIEGQIRFACFYPNGRENIKDEFIKTLIDVIKKTSRKPLELKGVFDTGVDPFTVNWDGLERLCMSKKVAVVFLIHPLGYDPMDLKNKFVALGMFFHAISLEQVTRKITYIDLAVELVLRHRSNI